MRTIWQALAWKEWHEQKWKLVTLTIVLCGINSFVLRNWERETLASCLWISLVAAIPLALFVGAGTAASERSRRTADFLAALPVPSWQTAFPKLLAGLLALSVAIAASFLVAYCWYSYAKEIKGSDVDWILASAWRIAPPNIRVGNWFVSGAVTVSAVAISVYLWTAAAGVNRVDEVSAGAKAVLIMTGWWAIVVLIGTRLGSEWFDGSSRSIIAAVVSTSPGGIAVQFPKFASATEWAGSPLPILIGGMFHVALATWFIARYGRISDGHFSKQVGLDVAELAGWLDSPRKSPLGAIAWKQLRETAPVVVVGIGAAVGITLVWAAVEWRSVARNPFAILELMAAMIGMFSMFISLVVGIGVAITDITPAIHPFWRSRPVQPDLWFWTKFLVGLLLLVATLLVPIYALAGIARLAGDSHVWDVLFDSGVLSFIGITASLYITSMSVTYLVRHAVYGAILGIAAMFVGPLIVVTLLWGVGKSLGRAWIPTEFVIEQLMYISVAAAVFGMLMISWLAVRYDWGRKSR